MKQMMRTLALLAAMVMAGGAGGAWASQARQEGAGVAGNEAQKRDPSTEAAAHDAAKVRDAASKAYAMPPVIVTADKRETPVQKTPMSITVLNSQDIEDGNIHTIDDVLKRIPNLQLGHFFGGSSFITFRGMPTATGTSTNPLVVYIDGVSADTMNNLDANLMDIERVEVLRGAQSVVYGKNTLGGIINIITRKPDNTYTGRAFSRVETPGSYSAGASVSGPLKEDLLYFSLSAMHDHTRGFTNNLFSSKTDEGTKERVKGQLRATPTASTDFSLHFDYTDSSKDRTAYSIGTGPSRESRAASTDFDDFDTLNLALSGTVRLEAMTFETISTGRFEHQHYAFNMDNIVPGAFFADGGRKVDRTELTQEFRLRSPDGAAGVAWLAGLYGSYADLDMKKIEQKFQPIGPLNPYLNQPYREYAQEVAPFGQLEFPLARDWKLTTGLRWHYTHRDASINYEPNADLQALMGATPMSTSKRGSWNELLPRVSLSWQLSDEHMLYTGVSRSFVPGGFNFAATKDISLRYDSETAWNYEVGAKTAWFGQRLSVNPVLFYTKLKDLQVMSWDAAAGVYTADNAGWATSYGAELDVQYRALPGLDAELSLGYTHAKFDEYSKVTIAGASVYDNNWIPNTPRYSGMAALQYRHPGGLFARGEVHYSDKLYWDEENQYSRSDVLTVNARVGYELDAFGAYVYGRNIFDRRYHQYYSSANKIGFTAEPQTFGVELTYRF